MKFNICRVKNGKTPISKSKHLMYQHHLYVLQHTALMSTSSLSHFFKIKPEPQPCKSLINSTDLTLSKAHNSHIWRRKKKFYLFKSQHCKIKTSFHSPYFQNILGFIPLICPLLGQFLNLKGKIYICDFSIKTLWVFF